MSSDSEHTSSSEGEQEQVIDVSPKPVKSKKEKKDKKQDNEDDELEIDLNAQIPLSKKQQRQLKKGKLDLEKLAKKHPAPKPENAPVEDQPTSKKSEFAVWIGNLSFDTTKEDLIRFITNKTTTPKINEDEITRVNIPRKGTQIKGFAYVDVTSPAHVDSIITLSESVLNGRKLLIKNANSFEGRPEPKDNSVSNNGNPPSRILFVGNLSFDTTEDLLEEHFRHCGEIVKIRMATFQDTGKCKGFAFVDFKNEEGATNALKSKMTKMMINRKLRMEYGEDRSKKRPKKFDNDNGDDGFHASAPPAFEKRSFEDKPRQDRPREDRPREDRPRDDYSRNDGESRKRQYREREPSAQYNNNNNNKRLKSSVALAGAQRASAAIVPSSGKKIKFD
ncbi:NOP13 Nucleolar protein 13 [Candida maltosa Xu316]